MQRQSLFSIYIHSPKPIPKGTVFEGRDLCDRTDSANVMDVTRRLLRVTLRLHLYRFAMDPLLQVDVNLNAPVDIRLMWFMVS